MLKKGTAEKSRKPPNDTFSMVRQRIKSYRDSLSGFGWKETDIMLYDRISLEKHVYFATKAETSKLEALDSHAKCRTASATTPLTEQDIMLFDRIALENHSYVATQTEKIRNSTHWILTLNKEGAQQILHQGPDFAQAKRECKRLHDEHLARTQQDCRTIPRGQQVRQRKEQQFEGIERIRQRG